MRRDQVTRGEGGGNAAGNELGPDLGLRRENEDRVAHYRSGTVDIFNLDRIDFFYNQSAPLTQYFWDEEETLRRVTRVIRETQPEIYIGFTPTLAAGHGNHQQAGRLIWEGVLAAADPTRFPEQLKGPHALSTWQVKKVFSGGSTAGHRRYDDRRELHHRLHPDRPGHRRGRVDRLRLAVQVAGREPAGTAGRDGEDLAAGRGRGPRGVPDAEPGDVQGDVGSGVLAVRHDASRSSRSSRTAVRRPGSTTRSCSARPSPIPAGCRWGRWST